MSALGGPVQAMAFAETLGDDADSFCMSWNARDVTAIKSAWPEYFNYLKNRADPDWFGKFDRHVLSDYASEAYSDGEGRFSPTAFMRELEDGGLCIVGRGYNDADLCKRFDDALGDHDTIAAALEASDLTLLPVERDRGDGRMKHYGEGEQPWDTCKVVGWAAQGAAFSILRYLRRSKQPERDLKAAKVYYAWLFELAQMDKNDVAPDNDISWAGALHTHRVLVQSVLSIDECERLGVPADNMLY